ncbi:hypothetical protein ACYKDZ_08785 [Stutzerimonas stutzeri]|jgi:hypothetical protein
MTVEHVPETPVDIACDVCCQNIRAEGDCQYGILLAYWGHGSQHDGERYEVHLCEPCFFRTLSHLRRERMVNTMFDEEPDTAEDEFGLVRIK